MTRKMIGLLTTFVLVLSACAAVDDAAQAQGGSAFALTPTSVGQPAAANDGGASSEGIEVHGRWTIEVRDPDGTVVDRREFENALTVNGENVLTRLLTGADTAGEWGISLTGTYPSFGCPFLQGSTSGGCFDTVGSFPATVAVPWGSTRFTLSGSYLATQEWTSTSVATAVILVPGPWNWVTATTLDMPITVAANQTVYVEVEISFS